MTKSRIDCTLMSVSHFFMFHADLLVEYFQAHHFMNLVDWVACKEDCGEFCAEERKSKDTEDTWSIHSSVL